MTWRITTIPSALALAAAIGCGRGKGSNGGADSASAGNASTPSPTISTATFPKPPCPATGLWAQCSVEQRIRRAGLVAKRIEGDSPSRGAFSVRGAAYALGRDSRLEIFVYPSQAALAADVAKMDTIKVAPRGATENWGIIPPTLIRSANLAAVLLTRDAREADRLFLAITAGPPSAVR